MLGLPKTRPRSKLRATHRASKRTLTTSRPKPSLKSAFSQIIKPCAKPSLRTPQTRTFSTALIDASPEGLQLYSQQILTQSHAAVMAAIARRKFPSPLWSHLTPTSTSQSQTGSSFEVRTDDDFYAVLASVVAFHHAQVYVPKSSHSNVFLPKTVQGQISTPIDIEHVHKTISLPLNLSSLRKHNLPSDFNSICIVDGSVVSNTTERLTFDVAWQSQSTKAPLGIDEHSLFCSMAMPESFYHHLQTIAKTHPQFCNSGVEQFIQTAKISENNADSSSSTTETSHPRLHSHYFFPNTPRHTPYKTIRLDLLHHYGFSWREGQSFQSADFFPLLLHAWATYSPSLTSPSSSTQHPPSGREIRFKPDSESDFHYQLLWFALYSLSHPTNYLWDRLSLEFMGYEGSKEGMNGQIGGLALS